MYKFPMKFKNSTKMSPNKSLMGYRKKKQINWGATDI